MNDMKAKLVKENIDFERAVDPKKSLKIGKERFKQIGDVEIGKHFLAREIPNEPRMLIINTLNGKKFVASLYAYRDIIEALEKLID